MFTAVVVLGGDSEDVDVATANRIIAYEGANVGEPREFVTQARDYFKTPRPNRKEFQAYAKALVRGTIAWCLPP